MNDGASAWSPHARALLVHCMNTGLTADAPSCTMQRATLVLKIPTSVMTSRHWICTGAHSPVKAPDVHVSTGNGAKGYRATT